MSSPKIFSIQETLPELTKVQKSSNLMIGKRVQALIVFKKHEVTGISKREVAKSIGVNHNSVQNWRNLYIYGGLESLINHSKTGFKPSIISPEQEEELKVKLHNPENGIIGYVELLAWYDERFKTKTNYSTLKNFVQRKFKTKIKTARKSHVKKDPEAVATFKKTLVKNAKT
jgi:transposase